MLNLTRRLFGGVAAASVAAASAAPSGFANARSGDLFVAYDGSRHRVSDAQRKKLNDAFGRNWPTWDNAEQRRKALQALSMARHNRGEEPLTKAEYAEMRACDDVCNMNNALRHMKGRDYREIFGRNATIDQIHGNRCTKACGCVVNYIFDHTKRHEDGLIHHPHYPTSVCDDHAHLASDFKAHFAAVMRG